ncbi:aminotransferase class I/II-fold pyridoxal phosphate-dependent enzyme [Parasedimentitalea psychrophila]|uniref:Aminotransferase n=1 Tax=Parasedimentitalea psychrophila TaxID=2997337 RepID=A0A9Y2KYG3_9RHOB|nr:aminotransferase class I/II-fold pyridoxal phosphate-dependent enzyme [Parasedimentitalea psychrophila]WIY24067.1 aminotransferase class I/II-fold pyridoxal phosphate-dependent enzyme [Parasedimentitalea psychrophila]
MTPPDTLIDLSIGVVHPDVDFWPSCDGKMSNPVAYPDRYGDPELRARLSAGLDGMPPVAVTAGASMALVSTFAVLQASGPILIPRPGFPGYHRAVKHLKIAHKTYDMSLQEPAEVSIRTAIKQAVKGGAIVIANPGNPLGTLIPDGTVSELCAAALTAGIQPILDETYRGLVFDTDAIKGGARVVPGAVQVFSLSKGRGLAGARLGYLTAPQNLLQQIVEVHQDLTLGASQVSQSAVPGTGPLQVSTLQTSQRRFLRRARDRGRSFLSGSRLKISNPIATPAFWVEFPDCPLDSRDLAARLRDQHGILVEPGDKFGIYNRTAIRICFALPEDKARWAFTCLAQLNQSLSP